MRAKPMSSGNVPPLADLARAYVSACSDPSSAVPAYNASRTASGKRPVIPAIAVFVRITTDAPRAGSTNHEFPYTPPQDQLPALCGETVSEASKRTDHPKLNPHPGVNVGKPAVATVVSKAREAGESIPVAPVRIASRNRRKS